MKDIFDGRGIEISLDKPDDFLKIKETLTRIGIASKKDMTLYQSCHILHKQNRYVIIHFKELFDMDGRPSDFEDSDESRRNTIARLLQEWGLIKILDTDFEELEFSPMSSIKIISHKDKGNWTLKSKYQIGKFST